jgi:hypothetical protein
MRFLIGIIMLFYSRFLAAGVPPRLESLRENIVKESLKHDINPALVAAMIFQESGGKLDAHEYSYGYPYFYKPAFFAEMHNIPLETEMEAQRTSYGLMQIKCSTARYIGFSRPCQKLYNAPTNLAFGVKYLAILKRRYKSDPDMISAYNQGQPFRFSNGQFKNYRYVRNVLILEKRLQQWFPKPKPIPTTSVAGSAVKEVKTLATPFEVSRLSFSAVDSTVITKQTIL